MQDILSNPDTYFFWTDIAVSLGIYVLSVYLFLKHRHGYISSLLVFGLFVFPLSFSIWFLSDKIGFAIPLPMDPLKMFYLFFVKFCLLFSFVLSKR
jgi:hypothetical protein